MSCPPPPPRRLTFVVRTGPMAFGEQLWGSQECFRLLIRASVRFVARRAALFLESQEHVWNILVIYMFMLRLSVCSETSHVFCFCLGQRFHKSSSKKDRNNKMIKKYPYFHSEKWTTSPVSLPKKYIFNNYWTKSISRLCSAANKRKQQGRLPT